MRILIINGPNINMIGIREPEIYGSGTYDELCDSMRDYAEKSGIECVMFQSNHEGDIIDRIQSAYGCFDGIVINPAGYSHTSIAIADAIRAVGLPTVEVHLTDIFSRESYRHTTLTGDACAKIICGKGFEGYKDAINMIKELSSCKK